jgi:hypothetical protein
LKINPAAHTTPHRLSAGANLRLREEYRRSARIENQPRRPHYPTTVIGRSEPQVEGRIATACRGWTTNPAVHTTSPRLSALSGEKMNQLVDFRNRSSKLENRNSQITNRKSPMTQSADGLIASPLSTRKSHGPTGQALHVRRGHCHARAAWGCAESVYNGRLVWLIRSKEIWS